MALRAHHADWGPVLAHLDDLGCGQSWEQIWNLRPRPPLTCPDCSHPMHAKVSPNGRRFFAHDAHAPDCAVAALESDEHRQLKADLHLAARDAGWEADMEVRAADGTWRADVLVTHPQTGRRVALEAQLSAITVKEVKARTERMAACGVDCCWFTNAQQPDRKLPHWLGKVPSLWVKPGHEGGLAIRGWLARFSQEGLQEEPRWNDVAGADVTQFLRWLGEGKLQVHLTQAVALLPELIWTTPDYIQREEAFLPEWERLRARKAEAFRKHMESPNYGCDCPFHRNIRPGKKHPMSTRWK